MSKRGRNCAEDIIEGFKIKENGLNSKAWITYDTSRVRYGERWNTPTAKEEDEG
jgi:hypothetical protein